MNDKTQKAAVYIAIASVIALAFAGGLLLTGGGTKKEPADAYTGEPKPADALPESAYPKEPVTLYQSDKSNQPGPEWDNITPSRHRLANMNYYGDFYPGNNPVLTLKSLPPHRLVRATFDLVITDSWDGSTTKYGPSLFNLALDDDRVLLNTTFCNLDFSDNMEQAFPDNYPCLPYRNFTMATKAASLGLMRTFAGGSRDCSSVYHLQLTFPHADPQIAFSYTTNIRDGSYKGYGVANMKVEALGQFTKFSDQEFAKLWADLGDATPDKFWKAKWALASAGDEAANYIEKHLDENIDMSDDDMAALVKKIKYDEDLTSWNAMYQLRNQGPKALSLLQSARASGIYFINIADRQYQENPTATSATVIRRQRLKALLDVIHTPKALDLKTRLTNP